MKKSVLYKGLVLMLFILAIGSQTIADAPNSNYDDPKYTGDIVGQINTCLLLGSNEGVRVYIPGSSFEAITGSVGNFKMSHVQSGTYNLTVTQNGHTIGTIPKVTVVPKQIKNIGTVTFCLANDSDDLREQ
ncbi:carboxypeptidase-like regulatory domain-containing protein [Sulfurovum sp. TSL1]|uniref:carboxypeptidase-like regulatory domain-containing protein n=1 Tax=Sulfurovum sp. TSL1 TaxID=2826994 RepID=UPI001CC632CD|nr:carboxypeptidase-like regulatory domain-containing protein [Sulfurovum sp. TSL1]GIT98487.1 hypothetical protein TSL1_13080 [Sulfurovum sp. TSL1]